MVATLLGLGCARSIEKPMATIIGAHIQLILIVTGAITAIALLQFIAPASVLRMIYGEAPADRVGLVIARHWGLLIFLVGALLVYAAFNPSVRGPAMVIAVIEKAAFAVGIFGTSLRTHSAAAAAAAGDSVIALIYVLYLAGF
jgi:hypothetical protein